MFLSKDEGGSGIDHDDGGTTMKEVEE